MIFGRKRDWDEQYDEDYVARADRMAMAGRSIVWVHALSFAIVVALILVATGLMAGQVMFEKTLTALCSPVGLVWLILLILIYFGLLFRQSWSALVGLGCWLLLSVTGNSFVSNQLMLSLERPYLEFSMAELDRMEVVFVLGGGTATNLAGQPQANSSGDRVLTAARMYHAGKVDEIVCTGVQSFRTDRRDLDPNEEAAQLLSALGVPQAAIARISGVNTAEEMQLASEFLAQRNKTDKSVGIITSAWHLNRVNQLAQRQDIQATLIPAEFRSRFFTTGPHL